MLNEEHSTESESEDITTNQPAQPSSTISAATALKTRSDKKTHTYLVGTMNSAFTDYDFSDVDADSFTLIPSIDLVMHNVNTTLFNAGVAGRNSYILTQFNSTLWSCLNDAIDLSNCIIFSYTNTKCDFDILRDGGCM